MQLQVKIEDALAKLQAGKVKPNLTKAQKIEKAQIICGLYAMGEYTLDSCCKAVSVNYYTFQSWSQPQLTQADMETGNYRNGFVPEIHDSYKECLVKNNDNFLLLAKSAVREGLLLKARGCEVEEISTEIRIDANGQQTPAAIKKTKKIYLPSDTALIFLGKNVDSETFKDRLETTHTGRVQIGTGLESLTDEELKFKRAEIEKALESLDGM